jgi:predicted transcriptional regulator
VGAVVPQVRIFDLENAKYLLEQGWTQKQIAKEQGVSAATVWRYLTSAGLGLTREVRLRRSVQKAKDIAARLHNGETRSQIASDLGLSKERICQILALVIPRRSQKQSVWSEATTQKLRKLWDEGHSTAEIGRRLGLTKNQVLGKAHRLGLPGRASPRDSLYKPLSHS